MNSVLADRIAAVRERIGNACRRSGRSADSVRLVAVSKTRPASDIEAAARLGVTDFGENRIQEAVDKLPRIGEETGSGIVKHLVGHLQSNKARAAVKLFDVIQSVDSVGLARRLGRIAAEERPVALPVLVQVDLAGEETKHGVPESDLAAALGAIREIPGLELTGLMTIPPFDPDPEAARPFFVRLRNAALALTKSGLLPDPPELSMGMSGDFEVAIEEGATLVRVGTAIFGPRS